MQKSIDVSWELSVPPSDRFVRGTGREVQSQRLEKTDGLTAPPD
jgi:hypothetical protein